MASRILLLLRCLPSSSPSSRTMMWASYLPVKLLLDLSIVQACLIQACLLDAIDHRPAHGRGSLERLLHQCRHPGRPHSRDSRPSTCHPLRRLPRSTSLKSLLRLLLHPLKRYLLVPRAPPAASSLSCSSPVLVIWHTQSACHRGILTASWPAVVDALQVKHKKPKAKAAAQPPLEALQPFEQRQRQQQLQQAAAPVAAQPDFRHVPPPPPPPPPQPEAPQPPAAFDSKPAPWAYKRPAAVPGMLRPPCCGPLCGLPRPLHESTMHLGDCPYLVFPAQRKHVVPSGVSGCHI